MSHRQLKISAKKQTGAVLILGLVLIMILSVLVISSAKTTVLQQKMSANLLDKELAFQSAESALMTGETYLRETQTEDLAGNFNDTAGLMVFQNDRELDSEAAWEGIEPREGASMHKVPEKPVYIIEELPEIQMQGDSLLVPRPTFSPHFRITSKAKGGTNASLSIHQVIYKK